jgi:hypothetical protein
MLRYIIEFSFFTLRNVTLFGGGTIKSVSIFYSILTSNHLKHSLDEIVALNSPQRDHILHVDYDLLVSQ